MRATLLILASVIALGALWPPTGEAQPAATGATSIKDPAESAAWAAATGAPAARQQAAALESFVRQYPSSVMKLEALEQAMADYQLLNATAETEQSARRILQIAPNDVRALGMVVFLERQRAADLQGAAQAAQAADAAADAGRGLEALEAWTPPQGMDPAQVERVRGKLASIFYAALGYERMVKGEDAVAKYYYLKAVEADATDVQTDLQLSTLELRAKPLDPEGFWWAAKAYDLAGEAGALTTQTAIGAQVRGRYRDFHGGDDGWDEILTEAISQSAPPKGFSVKPATPPQEIAVQAVRDNDLATLTVPDWEFILTWRDASLANHEAADRVWLAIMAQQDGGKSRLKLPVKVISASRGAIDAAITEDNRQANRADLHAIMAAPLDRPPAPGSLISLTGVFIGYTPRPFAFTMQKAEIAPN